MTARVVRRVKEAADPLGYVREEGARIVGVHAGASGVEAARVSVSAIAEAFFVDGALPPAFAMELVLAVVGASSAAALVPEVARKALTEAAASAVFASSDDDATSAAERVVIRSAWTQLVVLLCSGGVPPRTAAVVRECVPDVAKILEKKMKESSVPMEAYAAVATRLSATAAQSALQRFGKDFCASAVCNEGALSVLQALWSSCPAAAADAADGFCRDIIATTSHTNACDLAEAVSAALSSSVSSSTAENKKDGVVASLNVASLTGAVEALSAKILASDSEKQPFWIEACALVTLSVLETLGSLARRRATLFSKAALVAFTKAPTSARSLKAVSACARILGSGLVDHDDAAAQDARAG